MAPRTSLLMGRAEASIGFRNPQLAQIPGEGVPAAPVAPVVPAVPAQGGYGNEYPRDMGRGSERGGRGGGRGGGRSKDNWICPNLEYVRSPLTSRHLTSLQVLELELPQPYVSLRLTVPPHP